MARTRLRFLVLVATGLALTGAANAADEAKKPKVAPRGFYSKFLAPRMARGLNGEVQAAIYFANPSANPWTRDDRTVSRVENRAIRATTGALKRYAIESLGIDAWSLPLVGGTGSGVDALRTNSGGTRLLFGFTHGAPRAEVLIPVNDGRVALSADALGRMGATFQTSSSSLRVGASFDARTHDGAFSLTCRF